MACGPTKQLKSGCSSLITPMGAALKVVANWAKGFNPSPPTDGVATLFAPSDSPDPGFDLNLDASLHVMATVPSALIGKDN